MEQKRSNSYQAPLGWLPGRLKWFDGDRDYGFITVLNEGQEKDAYIRGIVFQQAGFKTLDPTIAIEVLIRENDRGLRAIAIRVADPRETKGLDEKAPPLHGEAL